MRLTLLSLPLLALVSSQAVWNTGDGAKYAGGAYDEEEDDIIPNDTITSAIVADGIVDLSTGEDDEDGDEIGVFQYCTKLETVRLPESLRKIGERAFYHCYALVHVDIPSGVNEIGECAFSHCSSLKTVTIPEGVVDLPSNIFWLCQSLKSVKLPSSLKTIGVEAFYGCPALTTINDDALEGVTEIGSAAFSNCKSLASLKLPPSLKTIEYSTFRECLALRKITIPPRLEVIERLAFLSCTELCVDLPESIVEVQAMEKQDLGCVNDLPSINNTLGRCIRLPTSVEFLRNGWDLEGLLHRVEQVVISSRIDVQLLINFIDMFEDFDVEGRPYLHPELLFKVLHSDDDDDSSGGDLPPIDKHVPENVFSYDIGLLQLRAIQSEGGRDALRHKVKSLYDEVYALD